MTAATAESLGVPPGRLQHWLEAHNGAWLDTERVHTGMGSVRSFTDDELRALRIGAALRRLGVAHRIIRPALALPITGSYLAVVAGRPHYVERGEAVRLVASGDGVILVDVAGMP